MSRKPNRSCRVDVLWFVVHEVGPLYRNATRGDCPSECLAFGLRNTLLEGEHVGMKCLQLGNARTNRGPVMAVDVGQQDQAALASQLPKQRAKESASPSLPLQSPIGEQSSISEPSLART